MKNTCKKFILMVLFALLVSIPIAADAMSRDEAVGVLCGDWAVVTAKGDGGVAKFDMNGIRACSH